MSSKRIVIGGVGLVKGHVSGVGAALIAACELLEDRLETSGWFPEVPFTSINYIIRLGTQHSRPPPVGAIRMNGELQTAIEVPMSEFRALAKSETDLQDTVLKTTGRTLLAVGSKFS